MGKQLQLCCLHQKLRKSRQEKRCFFQVSWIRCHIVRIQGDLRKICQTCVQLNKQTNKQRKLKGGRCFFRFLDFGVISFEYRERKKKEIPWKIANFDNLANPSPILPTFCHGNEVKPRKFERNWQKLSFVWRESEKFFLEFFGLFWLFLEFFGKVCSS